jgi:TPR repeat protein
MTGKGVEMSELEAIRWLKRAGKSSPRAAYELACCLEQGLGVEADANVMLQYLEIAAKSGHTDAQYKLAMCYVSGKGCRRMPKEGYMWAMKAAQYKHAEAMTTVANLLYNGLGVTEDKSEAMHWYLQASRAGDPVAQYMLGRCNAQGIAVPHPDLDEAAHWYRQAAAQGHEAAAAALRELLRRDVHAESSNGKFVASMGKSVAMSEKR